MSGIPLGLSTFVDKPVEKNLPREGNARPSFFPIAIGLYGWSDCLEVRIFNYRTPRRTYPAGEGGSGQVKLCSSRYEAKKKTLKPLTMKPC